MKKILILLMILLMPVNALAYSDYIYRGGSTLGIEVSCDGILIVGFYQINGKYNKGTTPLQVGDYIKKVNGVEVFTQDELRGEIEKFTNEEEVVITFKRGEVLKETNLKLIKDDGIYKTGLYIKDSIIGIGTLTYIDPKTNIYGALGHEIIESNSKKIVEIRDGNIFKNEIVSIDKSSIGKAGSKNAKYYYDTVYGNIYKNTNHGIFGNYQNEINDLELLKVGKKEDIKIGKANIYTVIDKEKTEKFEIEITSINETSETKNITFKITDKDLLNKTGGVVQGMSGSPIVQDDLFIGVVTHVIVDNPYTGYGLFITTMLETGEQ